MSTDSASFSTAVACIALVAHRAGRTELQGDGVVPVSQLSFTKAEEAHFKGAKKMGDVEARSGMPINLGLFARILGLFYPILGLC